MYVPTTYVHLLQSFGNSSHSVQNWKVIWSKGTFYSESAGEMWNRHIRVPKIVPGLLFFVQNMNCSNKMMIFTFFCVNQINVFKTKTNMYWGYNQ